MPVQLLSVGIGAPTLRVLAADINAAWDRAGGRGQVGVCASDEDPLTLAWEAATGALTHAGIEPSSIDGLWWGTTRPPFAEGPSHAFLATALGLAPHSSGALLSGSPHSGMDALFAAADAVGAGSARIALVVVSDALRPGPGTTAETRIGAGAAAMILTADRGKGSLGVRITRFKPVVDRYRGDTELTNRDIYDGRLFREEVFLPLVGEVTAAIQSFEPRAWSIPDPDGRLGATVAKRAGVTGTIASTAAYAELGDTGAAAPLLGLLSALDAPGVVALVAYGGGRATGLEIRVDEPIPGAATAASIMTDGTAASYAKALRVRGDLVAGGETIPMGVPPESAMFVRGNVEMMSLLGGRCEDCGAVSTPPSIHPHCVACGGPKLEPVALARSGTVHTYVVNYTMPAPFEAPLPIAVLDLDDGARVMLQVADDGSAVEIGARMKLVLRRYSYERGVPVYGYKAKPATARHGRNEHSVDGQEPDTEHATPAATDGRTPPPTQPAARHGRNEHSVDGQEPDTEHATPAAMDGRTPPPTQPAARHGRNEHSVDGQEPDTESISME